MRSGYATMYYVYICSSWKHEIKSRNLNPLLFLYVSLEELPIRLAHRVKELDELPGHLCDMPSIIKVKNWYAQSFKVKHYRVEAKRLFYTFIYIYIYILNKKGEDDGIKNYNKRERKRKKKEVMIRENKIENDNNNNAIG